MKPAAIRRKLDEHPPPPTGPDFLQLTLNKLSKFPRAFELCPDNLHLQLAQALSIDMTEEEAIAQVSLLIPPATTVISND